MRAAMVLGVLACPFFPSADAAASPLAAAEGPRTAVVQVPLHRTAPQREAPRSQEPGSRALQDRKTRAPAFVPSPGSRACDSRRAMDARFGHTGLKPDSAAALLAELTKPAYLLVRLLATPTNHRAPPA